MQSEIVECCTNEPESVSLLRRYLRIPSVHPDPDYGPCVELLSEVAKELQLPMKILYFLPKKPVVIITLLGQNPELPSIMLNSHMDVVPVFPELWKYPPFGAYKDENGDIYARGAQDMKSIGIQYIETIRRYIKNGVKFNRTIHIVFVPDEETDGVAGMIPFVKSKEFKEMNVGFSLDEGLANEDENFFVYYAERSIWSLKITCPGTTGHGSLLHENTAAEKAHYIVEKLLAYREQQKQILKSNPNLTIGDVTTVNLTIIKGGVQTNVLPSEIEITFDVRVAPDVDHEQLTHTFEKLCSEAGPDVQLVFPYYEPKMGLTILDDSNIWWRALENGFKKLKLKVKSAIFPGGTDSRFIRQVGINAIGFTPLNNCKKLLHDNNECINEKAFLYGIDIYYELIQNFASA